MIRRHLLIGISTAGLVAAGLVATALPAAAQDTVKVGLILPMTGPSSSTGKQAEAAAKLFLQRTATRSRARRSS